jgi:hypothetical protein
MRTVAVEADAAVLIEPDKDDLIDEGVVGQLL